jgi:hypothetical protein
MQPGRNWMHEIVNAKNVDRVPLPGRRLADAVPVPAVVLPLLTTRRAGAAKARVGNSRWLA